MCSIRLQGHPLSKNRREHTYQRAFQWIDDSIRQGYGYPTCDDVANRFGISRSSATRLMQEFRQHYERKAS
jgi:hypothetical protein